MLALLHEREPSSGAARGVGRDDREGIEPAYLQLVMRRLWERERQSGSAELRVATLSSMGSLREIVSEHLGEAMAELTPSERRRMAEALPLPGHAVRREDRPAPHRPGAAHRRAGGRASPPRSRSWPAATPASCARSTTRPSYEIFHDVLAQPLLDWQARFHAAKLQRRAAALGMAAAAAAAIVLVLAAYILEPAWLEKAELATVDARFAIRGDVAVDPDIVIVDLDDASLAALGGGRRPDPPPPARAHDRHPAVGRGRR